MLHVYFQSPRGQEFLVCFLRLLGTLLLWNNSSNQSWPRQIVTLCIAVYKMTVVITYNRDIITIMQKCSLKNTREPLIAHVSLFVCALYHLHSHLKEVHTEKGITQGQNFSLPAYKIDVWGKTACYMVLGKSREELTVAIIDSTQFLVIAPLEVPTCSAPCENDKAT